ncbi:hypothetical protein ACFQMM_21740 [Saliphagus sp. GCM10025308]
MGDRRASASGSMPETIRTSVTPGRQYRFVAEAYINTLSEYEISGTYFAYEGERTTYDLERRLRGTDGTPTADTPKTVGWYDAGSNYGFTSDRATRTATELTARPSWAGVDGRALSTRTRYRPTILAPRSRR